jgi:hypothetical protein
MRPLCYGNPLAAHMPLVVHSGGPICSPMPPITALLHTFNDELRLGRALETLLPCTEIVIVDHRSTDATRRIACEYGARVVLALSGTAENHRLYVPRHNWILCLEPRESITEALQATLFEWSLLPADRVAGTAAFSLKVREQIADEWRDRPALETRLVPRDWTQWNGRLPAHHPSAVVLPGEVLRLAFP